MKAVFEIIGTLIVSLFFISVPILCTLSIIYNWFPGLKFILVFACFIEWSGLMYLLLEIADKKN